MSSHHESTPGELLREELLTLLRENLSIRIDREKDFYSRDLTFTVRLLLDGEEIASDNFSVEQ